MADNRIIPISEMFPNHSKEAMAEYLRNLQMESDPFFESRNYGEEEATLP